MNKTVALKLMILVVIGTLATALNLSIGLQETIGISWWGTGRAPHEWFGWPTLALEVTALSIVGVWGGYSTMGNSGKVPINGLLIFSSAFAIFGLVMYSRMAPISDLRIPDDLRARALQNFFTLTPELLAQLTALLGVGAIARLFATNDPRLKEQ